MGLFFSQVACKKYTKTKQKKICKKATNVDLLLWVPVWTDNHGFSVSVSSRMRIMTWFKLRKWSNSADWWIMDLCCTAQVEAQTRFLYPRQRVICAPPQPLGNRSAHNIFLLHHGIIQLNASKFLQRTKSDMWRPALLQCAQKLEITLFCWKQRLLNRRNSNKKFNTSDNGCFPCLAASHHDRRSVWRPVCVVSSPDGGSRALPSRLQVYRVSQHFRTSQVSTDSGAYPGFWSGGTSRVLTPGGPWAQNLLKIGGFLLKIAWKLHDFLYTPGT